MKKPEPTTRLLLDAATERVGDRHAELLTESQRIAGIGSWEWEIAGDEIIWSEGLFLILGRDPEIGTPSFDELQNHYLPESWQKLGGAIEQAITEGKSYELELVMVRADGTSCWTTTRGEAVRGPDGAVVRLRGTVHDITKRRRAEHSALDREELLREAQRIAGIGSWDWQVGSETISWSEGLNLILGREPKSKAPSYADLHRFYSPDSWAKLGEAIEAATSAGTPYEQELAMIRDNGEVCWTTTRGEAVRRSDGSIERLRGTVLDITDRKRAEDAAREREQQLREAQRIAGVGSWEWEVGSEKIIWSEGLHLILGRDPSLGAPTFSELQHHYLPESWARLGEAIEQAIGPGTSYEVEVGMLRADGGTCWTTTRGEAVRGPDGAVVRLRGTVHDITERMEQALTAQADRLSSMGLLAAGVAHEINNPLTYVLHNVQYLTETLPKIAQAASACRSALRAEIGEERVAKALGPHAQDLHPSELEQAVERIKEALEGSERIEVLIRSLSTFSRVEKVKETRVDLRAAIEPAIKMARNEMKYRAQLVTELQPTPAVWGAEGKLSQVFLNLLINAAHAIDEGDIENNIIRVRTWADSNHVYASVTDTGEGIPDQDLGRIFDPFFSTKQIGKGSGLGLSICRNIVTQLGGNISVASEVGRGSTFTVRLPLEQRGAQAEQDGEAVLQARTGGRILVVDDEPMIRAILCRMLGKDHEVLTASSGAAAQKILIEDQRFHIILCDLMMPQMTGMDLHQWLAEAFPQLARRVVFTSGGIFTPRAETYLSTVENLRVNKPFRKPEIVELLSHFIDESLDGS